MEAILLTVALILVTSFFTSVIALFRPLPRFGLPTRQRAGIVAVVSLGLITVFPTPPVEERSCASDDLHCLANKYLARAHDTCNAFMRLHWRSVPTSKWQEISQRNGRLVFSDWTWIDRSHKHGILYFGDQIIIDGTTFETQEPFTCRYGFFNNTGYFDFN